MAGIIKAGQWYDSGKSLQSSAFNFEDMSHKADDYLDGVRRHAAEIIAQAKQHAARIESQAIERGQQSAVAQAQQRLQARLDEQLATLMPALQQAIDSIRQSEATWLEYWQQQTVRLAAAIARRIVRRELSQNPEITLELVREALQLALGNGRLRLLLHPQDVETLGERAHSIAAAIGNLAASDIAADPEIEPGTCRVMTEFGVVDQTLDAQLQRIEEELGGV